MTLNLKAENTFARNEDNEIGFPNHLLDVLRDVL